jgi:hypothetical protein
MYSASTGNDPHCRHGRPLQNRMIVAGSPGVAMAQCPLSSALSSLTSALAISAPSPYSIRVLSA